MTEYRWERMVKRIRRQENKVPWLNKLAYNPRLDDESIAH